RLMVAEVVDRWYEGHPTAGQPNVSYFKVRLEDGRIVLLRYVTLFDRWAMVKPEPEAEGAPGPAEGTKGPGKARAKVIPFPKRDG
ncbi:MAG: hypothetical protein JRJ59_08605, partial [Deltaproteobacteria bacterium]|nr:hypothetical protein [Deltaproteobacteria bacterium]